MAAVKRPGHKHRLKFLRVTKHKSHLAFQCVSCGKERTYRRIRVHMLLTNPKTSYRIKERMN